MLTKKSAQFYYEKMKLIFLHSIGKKLSFSRSKAELTYTVRVVVVSF